MKIEKVQKITVFLVTTENRTYSRYSADTWYESMGESDDPVYNCENLEKLFQEYLNTQKNEN